MTSSQVICVDLSWEHRRGGRAHCLARLVTVDHGPSVAVLSELATNPRGREVAGDVATAAETLLTHLSRTGAPLVPGSVTWLLHHGPFSSPDSFEEPETFTRVSLTWADGHYTDDIASHQLLSQDQVEQLLPGVALAPVDQPMWTSTANTN